MKCASLVSDVLVLAGAAALCAGCAGPSRPSPSQGQAPPEVATVVAPTVRARHGVVVSVSPEASRIGCDVLRQGGSAIDAAVATAFALAVTWPEAGNIGGGGFMLIHPGRGEAGDAARQPTEPVVIDYRETAPSAARRDMYADPATRPSSYALAGVPGTVRGLALAHEKFGRRSWKELVAPAVRLAEEGITVDAALAGSLNSGLKDSAEFAELRRVYGKPDGSAWAAGDRLVQKDLAATLRSIADDGPDAFYRGRPAQQIVEEMRRGGGLVTADDLAAYRAKVRAPVSGTFRGHDVFAPPPPSSGGVCLVQMLNVLECFDLQPPDEAGRLPPATMHLVVEAMRRAFADRGRYLADPDFVPDIPVERLTSKPYAKELARGIDPARASRSEEIARDWLQLPQEGTQTTHFSVIDPTGMAVANTYTLEQSFGGKIVVRGGGFLLNNELGDFNPRPGVTDRQGLIGTAPNQVQPGKRPLSSMTPTIVAKDGRVVLVTGSPGGRTIINTVLLVTLRHVGFRQPLRDAVDAARFHHGWFPDRLRVELPLAQDPQSKATLDALRAMGHAIDPKPANQGDAHSIGLDASGKGYLGVADPRRGGKAAGY
jgi:gamma-glutamyltranspeptidase/glutathione hydrolase